MPMTLPSRCVAGAYRGAGVLPCTDSSVESGQRGNDASQRVRARSEGGQLVMHSAGAWERTATDFKPERLLLPAETPALGWLCEKASLLRPGSPVLGARFRWRCRCRRRRRRFNS
ncbi:hypothetical protein PHYPSEUDO_000131 [Phytophthora pseudosyringae]|uniref:Uncharacterized protein n=1 Tax=Phytophthora pseudosyringae TaxID=221518 RepID=A0A8T1WNA4_9STRA|nr:hypothetical protein PHYPSEUDO_000131 [Phytophthora pseudosyringae]